MTWFPEFVGHLACIAVLTAKRHNAWAACYIYEVLEEKKAKFERKFADCKNLHRYFGLLA